MAAGVTPPDDVSTADGDDKRLETVRLDAVVLQTAAPEVVHRDIARRLLREGQPDKAVAELIRFARSQPMNARTAAALVSLALATGKQGPILTLLTQGIDESEGRQRLGVLHALGRLQRRLGQEGQALETLSALLAEAPEDRRARLVLNALLQRAERWEELDASLDKQTRLSLRRRHFREASRLTLQRARMWGERVKDPGRAALRYGQAAQYAEQGQDPHSVFLLRLLWLKALHQVNAPNRTLEEAARLTLVAANRVGREARALAFIRELGIAPPALSSAADTLDVTSSGEQQPPEQPRRHTTQIELAAVDVEPVKGPAAEALLVAATQAPAPAADALVKLESRYIARGAWKDLADFYRQTASTIADVDERVRWLEKLAELLESELEDAVGAAKVWADISALTGDTQAVSEQVRILEEHDDGSAVKEALDAGVGRAQAPHEKARLLVLRAEEARARGDVGAARADFAQALLVAPTFLPAAAGLAEVSATKQDPGPVAVFERLLRAAPKTLPERGGLFRRLARLADQVADARLALAAWSEVLSGAANDDEALARLAVLARSERDDVRLEQVLLRQLTKDPRGEVARVARLELVAALERQSRSDEALAALREAVRVEPGHLLAWLGLVDRLNAKGLHDETAWALEHAATAAPDGPQRMALWQRLARLSREHLGDEARAEKYEERVERLRAEGSHPAHAAAKLPGGPLVVPNPKAPRQVPQSLLPSKERKDADAFAEAIGAQLEPEDQRPIPLLPLPPRVQRLMKPIADELEAEAQAAEPFAADDDVDDVVEVGSEEVVAEDDDGGEEEDETLSPPPPPAPPARRETEELPAVEPVELGDPLQSIPSSFGPSPEKQLSAEREALFERVRSAPLEADGYRMLAEHFDTANDANRSSLMLELARALEGDPNAAPRTPRLILSATDRSGLRHPLIRTEAAELVALTSAALCRLFPARGKDALATDEFMLESGKGAKVAADALLAAVRLLGLRAPDVFVGDEVGPPFSALQTDPPRLIVARAAVKKPLPEAELRFYAGRALFTLSPELLALRTLKRDQLRDGLNAVGAALKGHATAEARVIREALPARSLERLKVLWPKVSKTIDLSKVMEGARHSANRAGLVVCGGIAPVIAALRSKRALPIEVTELVRFAASERYLQLRNRRLGRPKP